MVTLIDTIEIKATPQEVFAWLTSLKRRQDYQSWHPDHVDLRWTRGEPFAEDSIVYFQEYIHGKLHKASFLCTQTVPNKLIEYKPMFPWSLFMPTCKFVMEPKNHDACLFTATINLRVGPLFQKFGGRQIEAVKRHMKEEGENLKRTLER